MLIAQISDTHILEKSSDQAAGASRAENLRRCIADINRHGVDLVIHTGDSVQNGEAEEYAHLREILADLEAPLYLVPGNRDRHGALRDALNHLSYLPRDGDFLHYVVEDHPIRLVALDSVVAEERKGVFCARRLAWHAAHEEELLFIERGFLNLMREAEKDSIHSKSVKV